MLTQAGQQGQMQALPDTAGLPVTQPTPAGHATAKAQFLGQIFPRNAGLQYKQDAAKCCPVAYSRPAAFGRGLDRRQQWLQGLPQFVVDLLPCHGTSQRSTAM